MFILVNRLGGWVGQWTMFKAFGSPDAYDGVHLTTTTILVSMPISNGLHRPTTNPCSHAAALFMD
jgi:hypothetical protein